MPGWAHTIRDDSRSPVSNEARRVAFSVGDFLLRHIKRKLLARERESSLSCRRHDAPDRVPASDLRDKF